MTYLVKIIINGVKITDIEYSKENEWKQNNEKSDFKRSVNRPLQVTLTTGSLKIVPGQPFKYP